MIRVTVRTVTGNVAAFELPPSDTVAVLKQRIEDGIGTKVEHQRVLLAGKVLEDKDEVANLDGETLHLVPYHCFGNEMKEEGKVADGVHPN
jgi:hypothetical protein